MFWRRGEGRFAVRDPTGTIRTGTSTESLSEFRYFSTFEEMFDDLVGNWEFLAFDELGGTDLISGFEILSFTLTDLAPAPRITSPVFGATISSSSFFVDGKYIPSRTADILTTTLSAMERIPGRSTSLFSDRLLDEDDVRYAVTPRDDISEIHLQLGTQQRFNGFMRIDDPEAAFIQFDATNTSPIVKVQRIAVPEPSSIAIAALGLATCIWRVRCKR